ncbi:MAG TPA: bifunctional DNA-binding transcriptional regulator/O6-methylguanine-DNA methyltransferase Ada [Pyrinomonadaceae bacterium]|jgi:AraC family transcriptional regulator of adaptative response/methylated-DNA-[protein]-cysteine methyltransferase|nr:bifunctional DNA-binding transcriptional regulator/O6-methylguanine-DNA methyltransferase Ada [Pyrinomonadaceae bacterium]
MSQDKHILRELRTIEEDIYWQSLTGKDARFDGIFFYGVRSTGIYCKPSCAARRPRREQVVFFPSSDSAEAEGFRACLRCRPREANGCDPRVEMILRVCRAIEANEDGALSLKDLGAGLGLSPSHLQRTFKSLTGITPRQYAAAHRLKQFKLKIKEGADVAGAIYDAGYGSSSRLYEKSSQQLGMTPATYRRGGKDMSINYTIVDCRLGRLLVATTARGVCAVSFGDSDEELAAALAGEYPAAVISRDDEGAGEWVGDLLRRLEGDGSETELPLDVRATTFQLRVWEELRRIPFGATRSYKEVAKAIGQPTATRAVARACATNPVALLTPCHRVVREGGELGGYRWGLERKRELLERERSGAADADANRETNSDAEIAARNEAMPLFKEAV